MPRKPRMYLPDIPAHIVQRGNNREPCFFSEDDYRRYLDNLGQALNRYHVKLHAYVLMTNHVHLLMTPSDGEAGEGVKSLLIAFNGLYATIACDGQMISCLEADINSQLVVRLRERLKGVRTFKCYK